MKLCEPLTIPNTLTLSRLIVSPVLIPFFLVYLLPFNVFWINLLLASLFLLFGLTDFFDGYYARKWGQVTQLGALLDPIADKFLLCATLIALLAAQKIFFYWVILLIGREFFVMGIRLVALERGLSIQPSFMAKIKTCIEILFIAIVIVNPTERSFFFAFNTWNILEYTLLIGTLILSFWSAYSYYMECITHCMNKEKMHDH